MLYLVAADGDCDTGTKLYLIFSKDFKGHWLEIQDYVLDSSFSLHYLDDGICSFKFSV
jgi:hypothetical protein